MAIRYTARKRLLTKEIVDDHDLIPGKKIVPDTMSEVGADKLR